MSQGTPVGESENREAGALKSKGDYEDFKIGSLEEEILKRYASRDEGNSEDPPPSQGEHRERERARSMLLYGLLF